MSNEQIKSQKDLETLKVWQTPTLNELDISETANGVTGSDGMGGGSGAGGNSSGS